MSKTYDLMKSSDMKAFMRNLEKEVKDAAKADLLKETYTVTCPTCNCDVDVPVGKSQCPRCKAEIDLHLDFDF